MNYLTHSDGSNDFTWERLFEIYDEANSKLISVDEISFLYLFEFELKIQNLLGRGPKMFHALKIDKPYADAIVAGTKKFEVRKNDRGYNRGDLIRFTCVSVVNKVFEVPIDHPINNLCYEITYVHSGLGLSDEYVVFGIQPFRINYKDNKHECGTALEDESPNSGKAKLHCLGYDCVRSDCNFDLQPIEESYWCGETFGLDISMDSVDLYVYGTTVDEFLTFDLVEAIYTRMVELRGGEHK